MEIVSHIICNTKKSTKLRKEAENEKRYSIGEGYTNEKGWRKEMHSMLV